MRSLMVFLALIGFSGWVSDPEEREGSGPVGDPRLYGRPVLLPEDSALPDAFTASDFFPGPIEGDHCESADAEEEVVAVRIDVPRLLRQEHGEMPRFRGPGAWVSLHPSGGFGRVSLSTSGPSSAGRPR